MCYEETWRHGNESVLGCVLVNSPYQERRIVEERRINVVGFFEDMMETQPPIFMKHFANHWTPPRSKGLVFSVQSRYVDSWGTLLSFSPHSFCCFLQTPKTSLRIVQGLLLSFLMILYWFLFSAFWCPSPIASWTRDIRFPSWHKKLDIFYLQLQNNSS